MNTTLFSIKELVDFCNGQLKNKSKMDYSVADIVTDSRQNCQNSLFLALNGENFDGHDFLNVAVEAGAKALCIDSDHIHDGERFGSIPVIIVEDTLIAYQNFAYNHRQRLKNTLFVGVTGSSGKTSTKEMLRSIFKQKFGDGAVYATEGNTNNHVGVPQNILNLREEHKVAIIEMGTNHPGEIEVLAKITVPDIALITSIGSCHLEFLGDLKGVAIEKSSIFKGVPHGGYVVFPDGADGQDILETASVVYNKYRFGHGPKTDIQPEYLGGNIDGSSFDLLWSRSGLREHIDWNLTGEHQSINAAAAAAVAFAAGIDPKTIVEGLEKCVIPGMRMRVRNQNGITWINDAYNANPDSMKAAISWLAEFVDPLKTVLVLGDMLELGEISEKAHIRILEFVLKRLPGSTVFCVGAQMIKASNNIKNSNRKIRCYDDSQQAVVPVREFASDGDTVFLKGSRGNRLEIIEPD